MDLAGEYPDVVIGCVGGGSNFSGLATPSCGRTCSKARRRLLAVGRRLASGAASTPSISATPPDGPIFKMHTWATTSSRPPSTPAAALPRHGPSLSALVDAGYVQAIAVPQLGTFEAAVQFTKAEGILPAPESAHAIRAAIDEALDAKAKGEKRVILFNLSGHGHFDLAAYEAYLSGKLQDYEYPEAAVQQAMQSLPKVSMPA
jgi:tryptophan synthase beta chain